MAGEGIGFDGKVLRFEYFANNYELDSDILEVLDGPGLNFLKNPVVQNIYKYQIDYLCNFAEKWFNDSKISLLDWGCGKGHTSYWLKKKGMAITSCDVSNNGASAFVVESPLLKMANIDVVELKHEYLLPFPDESFNVVLSFGVLEHVPNDLESLKEIWRILKPNGLFFCFYLPYRLSYTQNIQHLRGQRYHDTLYSKKRVRKLLEAANFNLLDIWHRALLPKNSFSPKHYYIIEKVDNWFCNYSLLKYLATNIEFVANKRC